MNYPKKRYSGESLWMNKEWLEYQYIKLNKTSGEIAKEFGCKRPTITSWVMKHNLKKEEPLYKNKEVLYQKHIIEGKNFTEIAEELNCSDDTIKYHLLKNNISIVKYIQDTKFPKERLQELYVEKQYSIKRISDEFGGSQESIKEELIRQSIPLRGKSEAQFSLKGTTLNPLLEDKQWLYNMYVDEKKGATEIGEITGHDARIVKRALCNFKIKVRNNSESKVGLISGEKHPNWKGGKSKLTSLCREYFRHNISPNILKRDNYTCQYCGKYGGDLEVHHVIEFNKILDGIIKDNPNLNVGNVEDKLALYNKIISDDLFNDYNNMITYCRDCHMYEIHRFKKQKDNQQPSLLFNKRKVQRLSKTLIN